MELAFQAHSPEDVRIVDRAEHPDLADIDEDLWLLDSRVPIRLVYDDDGRLIRPERIANGAVEQVRQWCDRAWGAGTPLLQFMQVVS